MDAAQEYAAKLREMGSKFHDIKAPEPEDVDRLKSRLMRTKTIQQPSFDEGDAAGAGDGSDDQKPGLKKILSTMDLISLGVGSCCGTGMYVVSGLVAKNVAGPAAIFSFIIAAIASILSGVCYGEFGVRVPKTSGSAYMYSYVTVGEFVAFLIGWNLILEYMIGSAAGASAISACFDALANHSMSRSLEANVGTVIGKHYPDFLGCLIALIMTGILAYGVKGSIRFNNILNVVNFLVWVFIIIAGLFYASGDNWSNDHGGFSPYGASGVFTGAATCFYAFIGFDIIATTGEEAQNPSRSIPRAILSSLVVCLVAYISVTLILTLMVPYDEIHGDSALIDMFVQNGASGAKWIVAVGALASLIVSLLGSMFPMPRVIYAMSRDGLLFESLSKIHPQTNTPLLATVITGVLSALMSLVVSLQILVEMMSIGTLLAYTLVSVSVLILRYQPTPDDTHLQSIPMAHKLDTIEEDAVSLPDESGGGYGVLNTGGLKDAGSLISPSNEKQQSYGSVPIGAMGAMSQIRSTKELIESKLGLPGDEVQPNQQTAQWAILYVGALGVTELITCMILVFAGGALSEGQPWAVLLLLVALGTVAAAELCILRQPQNKKKLSFMAPGVPILPSLAMFFNIYLMLKLPGLTWARLGIWICIGLLMYFGYSMMHSVKERKQKEKELFEQQQKAKQQGMTSGDMTKAPEDLTNVTGTAPVGYSGQGNGFAHPGAPASAASSGTAPAPTYQPPNSNPFLPQNAPPAGHEPWQPSPPPPAQPQGAARTGGDGGYDYNQERHVRYEDDSGIRRNQQQFAAQHDPYAGRDEYGYQEDRSGGDGREAGAAAVPAPAQFARQDEPAAPQQQAYQAPQRDEWGRRIPASKGGGGYYQ